MMMAVPLAPAAQMIIISHTVCVSTLSVHGKGDEWGGCFVWALFAACGKPAGQGPGPWIKRRWLITGLCTAT